MDRYREFKSNLSTLFDAFSVLILDPLLFTFVVFLIFTRIQAMVEYSYTFPQYSAWQLVDLDIASHKLLYIGFFIVFFLWMLAKSLQHRREVRYQKQLIKAIEKLTTEIVGIKTDIESIKTNIDNLRDDLTKGMGRGIKK
jgi:hypothetical protein